MQALTFLKKLNTLTILYWLIILLAIFFRLVNLSHFPPSLYWEEVALGYDAYAILQTGADHHGNAWPVVAFESFGDWKPSLYFYSIVPFIWMFGLSSYAVRLPAALSGVAIVVGVGFLASSLVQAFWPEKRQAKVSKIFQLVVMALTAVSPWAIMFSRAGWEVNLATGLILWGVVLFLQMIDSKNQKKQLIIGLIAVLLLVLSMYTYHAARIVAPLLGLGLVLLWGRKRKLKLIALYAGFAFILGLPLILSLGQQTTSQRFAETSIFSDISIIEQSNQLRADADNAWWARILYHRYLLFGREVVKNFTSHFSLNFLFISGDNNPRHSIQYMGQLYFLDAAFLVIGFFSLLKRRSRYSMFVLYWLIVAILPASITKASPHALRILPGMPVFMLLIGAGMITFFSWLKQLLSKKSELIFKSLFGMVIFAYLAQFVMFWRFYTSVYPIEYAQEWQYGYQQMVSRLQLTDQEYAELPVFISREYGRPAMYYWFYTQTNPEKVQAAEAVALKDQAEFLTYQNLTFFTKADQITAPGLVASSPSVFEELQTNHNLTTIETIYNLSETPIWMIYLIE